MIARLVIIGGLTAACASAPPSRVRYDDGPDSMTSHASNPIDPDGKLEIVREQISFTVDANPVPGTLVRPAAPGRWPAVVLMAGSGPTDRDWNSPLISGKNGSATLLAEALARHGVIVLRFDKANVGGNHLPIEKVTLDTYRDEGRAALAFVRSRRDVDAAHLFVAGHSEGGIHAIRVAVAEGDRLAGLLLLSSVGRPMGDILIGQLEVQFRTAVSAGTATQALADREMASLRTAMADFAAAVTIDPRKVSSIPAIQQLLIGLTIPQTEALSRALFAFDPAPVLAEVAVPVWIYNGKKDIQVDPELDAGRLEEVRKAADKDVTIYLAPDANHVLEAEPRSLAELHAGAPVDYNEPDRTLDPETVKAVVAWLAAH